LTGLFFQLRWAKRKVKKLIKNIIATCVLAITCALILVLTPMIQNGIDSICVYEGTNYNSMIDGEIRESGYNFPLLCENQELISLFLFGGLVIGGFVASFILGKNSASPLQTKKEMLGALGIMFFICIGITMILKETLPEFSLVVFIFSFLNMVFVQLGAYEKIIENKQVFQLILFLTIVFLFLNSFVLIGIMLPRFM
jgi:hypothetical protein